MGTYDETNGQLDGVRHENKNLSTEIKDIMDQISEGGRTIHEIDKIRKRLEGEKLELQAALEEAEGTLEQEENKVLRSQLELTQVKQEIERRIKEKCDELDALKKTYQKSIESMQASLENETRAKGEAIRQKKKLEADMNELSIALEHANGSNTESQATIKKYQNQIKAAQMSLEEEQIMRDKAREGLIQAERNHHAVATQLEDADRQRRGAEQELSDVMEQLSDCTLQNQALQTAKRKLDSEMQTLQADLEEMICESRIAEDKAKKAMIDAARLADELRGEQENAQHCEKNRRNLENQVKDMQTKLDEAEQQAVKGGRKVTSRLEQKIKDLESQFDDEQRRLVEAEKSQRRTTRRIKELTFSQEEDHKNHERMQELVDKLQNKVKSYKKQIEEAEEIAALNLAKFRKVQADLESSEERADINEQVLAKYKAKARGASVGPN